MINLEVPLGYTHLHGSMTLWDIGLLVSRLPNHHITLACIQESLNSNLRSSPLMIADLICLFTSVNIYRCDIITCLFERQRISEGATGQAQSQNAPPPRLSYSRA